MGTSRKTTKQPRYDDEAYAIRARKMDFHWDDVPMHYIPGEPVATHVYNCMHLLLPEGEKAMSKALAEALPLIDDPRLHEEVVGFIGQEATHARRRARAAPGARPRHVPGRRQAEQAAGPPDGGLRSGTGPARAAL